LIATEGTEITESGTLLCVLGDLCGHFGSRQAVDAIAFDRFFFWDDSI